MLFYYMLFYYMIFVLQLWLLSTHLPPILLNVLCLPWFFRTTGFPSQSIVTTPLNVDGKYNYEIPKIIMEINLRY